MLLSAVERADGVDDGVLKDGRRLIDGMSSVGGVAWL